MSTLFVCGSQGCQAVDIDDEAFFTADYQRVEWARQEKTKRGEYPSMAEQEEYFIRAYTRLEQIHVFEAGANE